MFAILLLYLLAVLFNFIKTMCLHCFFFVSECVAAICWCQLLLPNANDYQ